ncbi:MAG: Ig-like domain-containing protein, partial [Bacilli bacterium]|nr:Ig-like domain-containing protein [Bacilli bacterium]
MKIKNLFLLPLFLFAMSLSGCKNNKSGGEGEGGGETVHVTSVSLDKTELTLAAGEKATLKATVSPSSATNKEVKWSVDNNHVTVSDGEVTAVSEGESIVTVTTVDSNKTATCKVTVSKVQTVAVQSVILSANSNEVLVNETLTISATIEPSNATNKNLIWESSLESVATVDKNGVVTGVAAGEVTISAKAEENENISDSITITVKELVVNVPVESVAFTKQSETITKGFAAYLSYEISPSNATNKAVTWDSSNKDVAT